MDQSGKELAMLHYLRFCPVLCLHMTDSLRFILREQDSTGNAGVSHILDDFILPGKRRVLVFPLLQALDAVRITRNRMMTMVLQRVCKHAHPLEDSHVYRDT